MENIKLTEIYSEGVLSRAKAGIHGLGAAASNMVNKGQQALAGTKAAIGQTIGNQNMAQSGTTAVQNLKQRSAQAPTSQDARAGSLNNTFASKINKEISNFNSQLSKVLGVTDPSQLVSTLEQTSPEMAELYNSIQSIVAQVQNPQAPSQSQSTPGQKSGFNYTGSNQKLLDLIKNLEARGISRDQVMQYLNNKKTQ